MTIIEVPLKYFKKNLGIESLEIEQLNDENYLLWELGLEGLFSLTGVSGIISGTDPESDKGGYCQRHSYAWQSIIITLCDKDRKLYEHDEDQDAKSIWDTIRERERKRETRCPWVLRKRLARIFLEDFESVQNYIVEIGGIIMELEFVNSTVEKQWRMPPDEQIFWYIHGLPDTPGWNQWVRMDSVQMWGGSEKPLDIDKLVNSMRCRGEKVEKESRQKEGIRNLRCYKCRQFGHLRRECPQ